VWTQILPKASATAAPAGLGRSEPNANPFLPPPTGRMKLVRWVGYTKLPQVLNVMGVRWELGAVG
jgi:hypothetical protein